MFGFFSRPVRVGLSNAIDPAQRHGVVMVTTAAGGQAPINFTLDCPQYLGHAEDSQIIDMFYQVSQMGFDPLSIELMTENTHRSFLAKKYVPELYPLPLAA